MVDNVYHPAIEIFSCQQPNVAVSRIDISGNSILYGTAMGLRIEPCVNAHVTIESNRFESIKNSAILIRNAKHPQLWRLPAMVYIIIYNTCFFVFFCFYFHLLKSNNDKK